MTLESSAEFLCVGLKVLTKPLNMIQGLLTYSMEQSPSWEANQFAATQEILCFL